MNRQLLLKNLYQHTPKSINSNSRFAAVAIILFIDDENSELFMIKRTEHPDDPWSGQIGLPGGHQEEIDISLADTAIRETREETKILLTTDDLVSQIDDQQGYAQGGQINLSVRPFVFVLDNKPAEIQINYELERYYWLPISHFQHAQNHLYFDPMNSAQQRPGIKIDNTSVLWGMTYRIMTDFFSTIELDSTFISDKQH